MTSTTIVNIWIESEITAPILGGTLETNDNSDVTVRFENGTMYVATFYAYKNIDYLRQKNQKTGENLNEKYLCCTSDMIIVEKINRAEIEAVINHLIQEGEFEYSFDKVEDDER